MAEKVNMDEIGGLINGISNAIGVFGGVASSVIGATKGNSGSITTGSGERIVYGNEGDTSAMPKWLLLVGLGAIALLGGLLIFKNN